MICPSAGVDWDSTGHGVYNLDPRGFRIVNADPRSGIWLKSLVSKRESQNEVPHKRARVNPRRHVPLCQHVTERIPQGEVAATPKAVVKEVSFNGRTNYACAKNV